ncbi:MAG: hypothetical protein KF901_14125 [Myxococcales bacterium]|nr:hypothetical protein [Myxococcales bacterium]
MVPRPSGTRTWEAEEGEAAAPRAPASGVHRKGARRSIVRAALERVDDPLHRGVGVLSAAAKVGAAARTPRLHALLQGFGVLQRSPESWIDSPIVEPLPWESGQIDAPPAPTPPGVDAPWPQPPVVSPGLYAPVLHLDEEERIDHVRANVTRYLGQIIRLTPSAAKHALRGPRLVPVDDARFAALLTETSLGQFVSLRLEPQDRRAFGALADARDVAKVDCSFAPREHALPGCHVAPTVTLLLREGGAWRAAAIRVGERVVTPGEGASWSLAKYFVLQGAQGRLVGTEHPRLHFPFDTIRAVTRAVLPRGHVISRLLEPHTRYTAGLNESVIHHRRSVLHNSQREIYTPFPYTTEGIHALVQAGRDGVEGVADYAPYRFGDGLFGEHVIYGRYRRAWHDVVSAFVAEVLDALPPEDDGVHAVHKWAEHIGTWVPGFPSGEELTRGGALGWTLASVICAQSVYHTADHHSYAAIPLAEMPWRLRAPAPDQVTPASLDVAQLVSPEDHFRHRLCHAMFFAPVILGSLRDVRYGFRVPRARAAEARLFERMEGLDGIWEGSGFPSSAELASSIQY